MTDNRARLLTMAFRNDLLFSSLIDPSLYEMRNIIEIAEES